MLHCARDRSQERRHWRPDTRAHMVAMTGLIDDRLRRRPSRATACGGPADVARYIAMNEQPTPDLRGEMRDDDAAIYLMDHPDSDEEIPTLDMSPCLSGEAGGRERVAARLREITSTVGFFYLRGHGIPQDMIDAVFARRGASSPSPTAKSKGFPTSPRTASSRATRTRSPTAAGAPISTSSPERARTCSRSSRSIGSASPADQVHLTERARD